MKQDIIRKRIMTTAKEKAVIYIRTEWDFFVGEVDEDSPILENEFIADTIVLTQKRLKNPDPYYGLNVIGLHEILNCRMIKEYPTAKR